MAFFGQISVKKSRLRSAGKVLEQCFLSFAESSPYGLVIQPDLTGDLSDGIAVYQPEVKHLAVGLVMDAIHDKRFNLLVAVFRAI